MVRPKNNLKQNGSVSGLSLKVKVYMYNKTAQYVTNFNAFLIMTFLNIVCHTTLKRKEGNVPSKNIVFFNEDQSVKELPSKKRLKSKTDNRNQRKRNITNAV